MQDPIVTKPINYQDPITLQKSVLQLGIKKSKYPWYKQLILGWQAGFYLGMIGALCIRCSGNNTFFIENVGLQKFTFAIIFPIGLCIITLKGYELITANMAIYIPGLLTKQISL